MTASAPATSPMLDAALSYARLGWPVAPAHYITPRGVCSCGGRDKCSPGKHPMTRHGLLDATTDEKQIRAWWTTHPVANIMIRTGMVGDRCLAVLDSDPRHDGDESLRMLEARHGVLPQTLVTLTGSGGQHFWFWSKVLLASSSGKIAPGIDIRGDGGYVIAPPSSHESGTPYSWDAGAHPDDVVMAEAPAWLVTLVQKRAPSVNSAPVPNAFIEGGRNSALASLAGAMRAKGFERESIEAALLSENDRKCRPPLDPKEVQRISWSISRYAPTDPVNDNGGSSPRKALTFGDIIAKWKAEGPVVRAPTGWPTLDEASGGGLSFGRLVVLVGAPNVGKTAIAAHLADRYWRAGHVVGLLAVDEDPDDLTVRFAQMAGFFLEDTEGGDCGKLDEIGKALEETGVFIYDHGWTIETAAEHLGAQAKEAGKRAVFVVDSLQTTRSAEMGKADSPRLVVSATVRSLRTVTAAHGFLTLATSEMGRIFYLNEESAKKSNAMAAGKESGDIEYGAKVQIVLRSVKDHSGVIHAEVPKLKRGKECEFHLGMNRVHHTIVERDAPVGQGDGDRRAVKAEREAFLLAEALRGILKREPGIGEMELRAEWQRGKHGGVPKLLIAKREIGDEFQTRKVGRKVECYLGLPPEAEEES